MKRLFSWLLTPWVLSLIGIVLLSLVIWFEAPLLAFNGKEPFSSGAVRWSVIALLLLSWAGYFLWKMIAARRANARLLAGVGGELSGPEAAAQSAARESATEVAALNQRMQEAIALLRSDKGGKGGGNGAQSIYQLPWYMFIGAPGSGKTTALVQSGLKFPLADKLGQGAVGGVGGTRNCDWWFSGEAVLLDTAGRYTTRDSHAEVDKGAWTGFLNLLRKHRRRRPINGVIVALSVADLLQHNPAALKAQSQAIRERIKELHEHLGIRFPVYVMVTKCDLLAGFVEFFDNLGKEERAQVWGMSFPLVEAGQVDQSLAAFPAEFRALEMRLQERLLGRMQQERDVQRRALLYGFPQQFSALEDTLGEFLGDVFQSSRYEEAALLRGVYFTSGTQEGSPIDRVMGALAAAFNLNRQVLAPNAASGRSYFVTRLLRDVLFREAGLAGTNLRHERQRQLLQWGGMGLIAVVLVAWSAALTTSYFRNQQYVSEVAVRSARIEQLARAVPPEGGPVATLPLLDAVRDLPAGYAEREAAVPFLNTLGLYQGDKLGAGAQALYRRQLREVLLPRIVARMQAQLRRGDANNPDYLYELLRVYLMLGDRRHFDPESVRAWVDVDWNRNLPDATALQRQALSGHVAALLGSVDDADTAVPLDAALIAQTRLALARLPLPQRIYNRVKREVGRARLAEFTVTGAAGQDVSQLFVRKSAEPMTRGIPGIFTVAGYRQFNTLAAQAIVDVSKDSWVLAQQESAQAAGDTGRIRALVQQLYYEDYIRQWDVLLADVGIVPLTSLDQSARVTNALGGADSPLRKFLQAAARETTLDGASAGSAAASLTGLVKGKLDDARKKLESALAAGADEPATPAVIASNPVDQHFAALHKLVGVPGAAGPAPIDQVLALFKDAAVYFDAADNARKAGAPPPPGDAMTKLKRAADGQPAPIGEMLKNVDSGGGGLTLGNERARLNALWAAAGAQFCRQAVAGRYPMVRSATQEVTPDDFGRFFAPGGVMDDFFQKNLAVHVDMAGAQWTWRNTGTASLGIPQDVLTEFQRAARLRDMFFGSGGRQPSVRFVLKPLGADPALTKVLLDIDGQPVTYVAGTPLQGLPIQLPSGKGTGQVRFESEPAGAKPDPKTEGPWAWFRLLDKGTLEATGQGERFKLTMDLGGRKISYDLTASSVINPFRRDALEQFRCVDKL